MKRLSVSWFYVVILFSLELNITEMAKILLRVDKLLGKGSDYVKFKNSYKNFSNGSFAVNSTHNVLQTVDKEMVIKFKLNMNK